MSENILKFCIEKGLLLDKELLNILRGIGEEEAKRVLERLNMICEEKVITKSSLNKNGEIIRDVFDRAGGEEKKVIEKIFISLGLKLEIRRERVEEKSVKDEEEREETDLIVHNVEIPERKITVGDFVKNFSQRFISMRKILQERSELENLTSIDKLNKAGQASVIGMVLNKRMTKNKNLFLEVEDLTGKLNVLINQNNKELFEKGKGIILDDIIGIKGTYNKELFFVNDFVYPEAVLSEKKKFDDEKLIAFISDIHVGSGNFLEDKFLKFIDWINGKTGGEEQKKIAKKIKYLLICGDSVDGVGVFPGQEELINIKDIKEQYDKLAQYLKKIRKDIKIVIIPGQHDAVRVAEPQPQINEKYGEALYKLDNVYLATNPCTVELRENDKSFKILMYHGASFHANFIEAIEEIRLGGGHDTPAKSVKAALQRRHLSPTHSAGVYLPSDEDSMFIREVPDIVLTGDLHKPEVDMFNNILIVCSSCWQSITPFEEKVGNHPDPGKVPVYNLKTREVKILDFG